MLGPLGYRNMGLWGLGKLLTTGFIGNEFHLVIQCEVRMKRFRADVAVGAIRRYQVVCNKIRDWAVHHTYLAEEIVDRRGYKINKRRKTRVGYITKSGTKSND